MCCRSATLPMLYKPRFCCHCGDEIERVNWRFRDSRRFCDICETDHVLDDWAGLTSCFLFMIAFVTFYPSDQKTAELRPGPVRSRVAETGRTADAVGIGQDPSVDSQELSGPPESGKVDLVSPSTPIPKPTLESFCNAPTRKGTPCTRKVRKGERCWQHRDK
jgi:hypothetical protein